MSSNPQTRTFPPLDEHLVEPESGLEVVRGEVMVTAAKYPHARPQARLVALLEAHVAPGWVVATELTSRVAEHSDFTADASIRSELEHPEDQDHALDEISFEVVNTQRPGVARAKAEDLRARGVRRVFVIDIPRGRVREWSAGGVHDLDPEAVIEDRTLGRALPVAALLGMGPVREEVAEALLDRPPLVLQAALADHVESGRRTGHRDGERAGRASAVSTILERVIARLEVRGLKVSQTVAQSIRSTTDLSSAIDLLERAVTVSRPEDLLE